MAISPESHLNPRSSAVENPVVNVSTHGGAVQVALALRAFAPRAQQDALTRDMRNTVMQLWVDESHSMSLAQKFRTYVENHSDTTINISDPDALDALLLALQKPAVPESDVTVH